MRKFPITTSIKNVKPVKRIKFSSVSKLKKLYTWLKYLFSLIYPGFIKIVKNGIADVRPKICKKFADILKNSKWEIIFMLQLKCLIKI